MKTKTFKVLSIVLSLLLVLSSLTGCSQILPGSDSGKSSLSASQEQEDFEDYLQDTLVSTYSDYTSMHQLFLNPEDYGIDPDTVDVDLGSRFSQDDLDQARQAAQDDLDRLKAFDRDQLTSDQQDLYDSLLFNAEINAKLSDSKFDYYQSLFSPLSGLQAGISETFADWEVRNEKDVQDMITVMEDVRPYVDSALDYTQIQADKGYLVNNLSDVVDYCQGIVDKGMDSSILTVLDDAIDQLDLDKADDYKDQLKEAYQDSFLPAYQDMVDRLTPLEDEEVKGGLAALPDGKEYYELTAEYNLGYSVDIDDFKDDMQDWFNTNLRSLMTVAQKDSSAYSSLYDDSISTGFESYADILDYIDDHMQDDFPSVSDLDWNITDMNEEVISDAGVAAYFVVPPVDGDSKRQMRVNPNYGDIDSLDVYNTVAHEGLPRHMFQFTYMYDNDSLYVKTLADNTAYTEGYAVYASYEAMQYLLDQGSVTADQLDCYKYNELTIYAMINVLDIGINYEDWSLDDALSYVDDCGFSMSKDDLQSQYDQLRCDPCTFFSYYGGLKKIQDMKQKAQDKMGSRYSEQGFNNALLSGGCLCFDAVERHIDQYISGKEPSTSAASTEGSGSQGSLLGQGTGSVHLKWSWNPIRLAQNIGEYIAEKIYRIFNH